MDAFRIRGGLPLCGEVQVSGSKNASLPIMAAAILADGAVRLHRVPRLTDVDTLSLVLRRLGLAVDRRDDDLCLETLDDRPTHADERLTRRLRASFCVLGPLLARRGEAVVSLPGGCNIGPRPVDLHLAGLAALGAELRIEGGRVIARARRLVGGRVHMSGRNGPSVTGTANVLSAATLARGQTVITGAAREPEIADLGRFLQSLGARISGLGTATIEVEGVERLGGASHQVIADRIEAATLLLAGAITQGAVTITGVAPQHLSEVLASLSLAGALCHAKHDTISVHAPSRPKAVSITARPYPGWPTDLQAQWTAWMTLAEGRSEIRDTVFSERFGHVAELRRFGAHLERRGNRTTAHGLDRLTGADVVASDLRASAALVLAGLAASGETMVQEVGHLDRGYESLDIKLRRLGADIERCRAPSADLRPIFSADRPACARS
jgi:UDP-N-acetylglucosamine 1-carboxyvinyltransferase